MQTLKEYIESEIIPRYDNFDGAHRRDHVRSVIGQSQELSRYYDVNPEILYTAAAYHDLGLCEGREKHHLVSGRIIREDKTLLNWFSVEEIEVIAEAAEDHRASNETPPRSIYGKIIAESDRLIDPETVIRRTVQYGFAHYPQMNREQMWERTLTHLKKKYGYGGYLKLWIPESSNSCRLEELRKIIADEKRLRSMFDRFYDEEQS
ncbi:hD domain [Bacteroides sp. CAG:770]|nr:hD domain [Bacteroides sp. CAG:770]